MPLDVDCVWINDSGCLSHVDYIWVDELKPKRYFEHRLGVGCLYYVDYIWVDELKPKRYFEPRLGVGCL